MGEVKEKPVRGKLLNISEASEYIHLGKSLLYECINNGLLTYFRPPKGQILFDSADLDEWLQTSKRPAWQVRG